LLKHLREVGINSVWLMLVSFPGENDGWHDEVTAFLPWLHHLQPPADVAHVRFDRFSVYHRDPEQHGLQLEPYPAYAAVYPSAPAQLANLAYFFRDARSPSPVDTPGIAKMRAVVGAWNRAFRQNLRPVLSATDKGDTIEIFDTRAVAVSRRIVLEGLEAKAYRACEPAVARQLLHERLSESCNITEAEADALIEGLIAKRIVLDFHGKVVALCVKGDVPLVPEEEGGWARGYESPFSLAVQRARDRLSELAEERLRRAKPGELEPAEALP
jgi:magnesium-protoporphyrin IX monomethyl ester (oxidative) cyclase